LLRDLELHRLLRFLLYHDGAGRDALAGAYIADPQLHQVARP
jgi:hypothetical protein